MRHTFGSVRHFASRPNDSICGVKAKPLLGRPKDEVLYGHEDLTATYLIACQATRACPLMYSGPVVCR
jgi:hypothetical protein